MRSKRTTRRGVLGVGVATNAGAMTTRRRTRRTTRRGRVVAARARPSGASSSPSRARFAVVVALLAACLLLRGCDAARETKAETETDADDDVGVEEYHFPSPMHVAKHMQRAVLDGVKKMREEADATGEEPREASSMIFPGGALNDRAQRAARDRGDRRFDRARHIVPNALGGGAAGGARTLAAVDDLGGAAEEARCERDAADAVDAAAAAGACAADLSRNDDDDDGGGKTSAWGSTNTIGGLLVIENGENEERREAAAQLAADEAAAQLAADEAAESAATPRAVALAERYERGARVGRRIVSGAIFNAGAIVPQDEWRDVLKEELSPVDVTWHVAHESAERDAEEKARERRAKKKTAADAAGKAAGEGGDEPINDEESALAADETDEIDAAHEAFARWFESKGGVVDGFEMRKVPGKANFHGRGLVSTGEKPIALNQRVMRIPITMTLSIVTARNLRIGEHHAGEWLKKLFARDETVGLAAFLLHETLKEHETPGSSHWGPYVRTLGHHALGRKVWRALDGTYAGELITEHDEDAIRVLDNVLTGGKGICSRAGRLCHRVPSDFAGGFFNRDDVRWALGVVRSRAVYITRRTTGTRFLALVPMMDLAPHHHDAGGEAALELDNGVNVFTTRSVPAAPGIELAMNRGFNVTDAESMLRWHAVTPGFNPHGGVRLRIPGGAVDGADVLEKIRLLRRWRQEMAMPPRGSDLWRESALLGIYGDGDEELEAMKSHNAPSKLNGRGDGFAALSDTSANGATIEEELMLTGQFTDANEAAIAAANYVGLPFVPFAKDGPGGGNFMLYDVLREDEPGGDAPEVRSARRSLAKLAVQTQAAAAFGEFVVDDDLAEEGDEDGGPGDSDKKQKAAAAATTTTATTKGGEYGDVKPRSDGGDAASEALRTARDFFERGVPPGRGLDALDIFLLRKGHLMGQCGKPRDLLVGAFGPTDALMCATRVLLANETEVKALEGGGKDLHWTGERDAHDPGPEYQVRSIQTFFTHRPVSTLDRVSFQLTDELFLYGMAPSRSIRRSR